MDNFTRSLLPRSPDDTPIGTVYYDPAIIQEFAERLYSLASRIVISYVIGGALLGFIAGFGVAESAYPAMRVPFCIVGAVVLGIVGSLLAQPRAFQLRLEAQLALCQMKIEHNTRVRKVGER